MGDRAGEVVEFTYRAMASGVHVILVDPEPGAPIHVRSRIRELERRWSRFNPDSDLSRIVAGAGSEVSVSADTLTLLAAMSRAHVDTGGLYDPTLLRQILEVGYAVSIVDPRQSSITVDLPSPSGGLGEIRLDKEKGTAWIPRGLGLDPGGIGKGLAADLVVAELLADGTAGAMVSVGGDLFAGGTPPGSDGWRVQIEDPFEPDSPLVEVEIDGGGVATSSTVSRKWSHRGSAAHHVLDPLNGTMARSEVATVTAIAASGWQAEVHATAALVSGKAGAPGALSQGGCSGVVVSSDGSVAFTPDLVPQPVGAVDS